MKPVVGSAVIKLNPTQKRHTEFSELAKKILENGAERRKSDQQVCEERIKGFLLRRLHHMAYKGNPLYRKFPLSWDTLHEHRTKNWQSRDYDVPAAAAAVQSYFLGCGFSCRIETQKLKNYIRKDTYNRTIITIDGILGEEA